MTKEQAFREDEAMRYKKTIMNNERRNYWLKKRIEEDEKNIERFVPPIPIVSFKKVKWSESAIVGFRTAIRSLIP